MDLEFGLLGSLFLLLDLERDLGGNLFPRLSWLLDLDLEPVSPAIPSRFPLRLFDFTHVLNELALSSTSDPDRGDLLVDGDLDRDSKL